MTTDGCTAAALVRKVDAEQPTLLLDETDATFGRDAEYTSHLRGVINSGFKWNGRYTCCVGQGANIGTRDFRTFCPKAFSGIGALPDTVQDRSVPILMERKKDSDLVSDFEDEAVTEDAKPFVDGAKRWATPARLETLRTAKPERLGQLNDRQRDVSRILLAIAEEGGGKWPERVRAALVQVFTGDAEAGADSEELLHHLQTLYGSKPPDAKLPSAQICDDLCNEEMWPWGTYCNGQPITKHALALLLKPFGISPDRVRLTDGLRQVRGYTVSSFKDAWERYPLPPTPGTQPSQASQTSAGIDDS